MIVAHKCKFCELPLSLEIDEEYLEMGDHLRLLRLASCNRCADFMQERREIILRIKRQAILLAQRVVVTKEAREAVGDNLRVLLKRYMRHLADHRSVMVPDWDEAILYSLMSKPTEYVSVLSNIPKMFAEPSLL